MNADADTLKVSATGAMKHLWSGHTKVALWSAPNSRTRNKTASPFFSTRRKSPDTAQNRIRKERFCSRWGGVTLGSFGRTKGLSFCSSVA